LNLSIASWYSELLDSLPEVSEILKLTEQNFQPLEKLVA
jgi:hypothetical protein